jgi:2-oxoglutarate dehydrogenase E2 component (dihydrolipoamide succinyltransferase)
MSELENIPGTGQDGRVSKKDILQYVANKASGTAAVAAVATPAQTVAPIQNKEVAVATNVPATISNYSGNVEIIEMDRMRKLIAKHMVDSKQTSAHVTSFAECDVTNLVLWRERVKRDFEKREGEKITYTPLFIEAIVKSIKKYPWLSSSIDGDKIIIKKDLNIGMATALPNGNLIVPVIKNADQLNLTGLTKQVNGLANAARTGKLKPDDTTGGTFTLTNVGTFGSIMGTPIINQPQVAIMAVGAIKKRPVVIETPQGDSIAIRHMMYISLSYDHRIIDGSLGSTFLNAVCKELENFDTNRTI